MNSIYLNSSLDDDARRTALYEGQLFVFSARETTLALIDLARELTEEAFAPHHPQEAQFHLSVDQYNTILADLKPKFIHHPRAKVLIPELLADLGCDLEATYFDVPRLRTVTSDGYLTSGLGYAFKPHRDTWYSPPLCQLNWWLPIYDIVPENSMAFHMLYWDQPIKNSSHEFNYQNWQDTGRKQATQQGKKDTRRQAAAEEELQLTPEIRVVCPPGGLILFSAAHMHSTVPNTAGSTRLSIDFRTVHLDDVSTNHGAPNLDSACTGTTIRDYLRGTDQSLLPESIIARYESGELDNVHFLQEAASTV